MNLLPRIHFVVLLLVGFLATVFFSCKQSSDPGDPPPVKNTEIYPLAVGNQWISKSEIFDSTGNLLGTLTYTSTVVGDTTINGEQWFYFQAGSRSFYRNRTDGQYSFVQEWSAEPFLNLKYPAQVGQSYAIPYASGLTTVMATDTALTTTLGTYRCYQYRTAYANNWVYDYFYSSGVGMVASVGVLRSPSGNVTQTVRITLLAFVIR